MKDLLKRATDKTVRIQTSATVLDAIEAMSAVGVGAALVVEGECLRGIFTERDVMLRIVLAKRDPATTPVVDVMSSPVTTVRGSDVTPDDVIRSMSEHHFRHLAIEDDEGKVQALVSMRHVLQRKVEELSREVDSLEAYMGADGIGG